MGKYMDDDNGIQGTQYILEIVNKGVGVKHLQKISISDIDIFALLIARDSTSDDFKTQGNEKIYKFLSRRKMS